MKVLKTAIFVIGCLAALIGLIWIGQGTGIFPYPRNSFMIDEAPWTYRGVFTCAAGCVVAVLTRPPFGRGKRPA